MDQEQGDVRRIIHLAHTEVLELQRLIKAGVPADKAVAKVSGLTLEEVEAGSYRIVPEDK